MIAGHLRAQMSDSTTEHRRRHDRPGPSGPVVLAVPRWTRDGGVGAHVAASAAALAAEGTEVMVLCGRADAGLDVEGVDVVASPPLFDASAAPAERVAAALERPPSVFHVHQVEDPALLRWVRERAPVVVSVHGYTACTSGVHYFRPGEECMRAHGPGCIPHLPGCAHTSNPGRLPRSYRQASRSMQALGLCDLAMSYSSAIDRHLAINGVSPRAVVPLFATTGGVSGTGHEGRRRVVFAGRVVAPKGIDVLIRAAADVDAELVICGDGWRLGRARELAARSGIADRVRFTGWLDPRQLAVEIAEASVVAIPSIWPEPFGLGGIEAFEAGRPVVASLTGGIGDWLEHGVNGLAVRPGDARELAAALNELLADPERQREMGEAGRTMAAERYTPARHVAELHRAYQSARASWRA